MRNPTGSRIKRIRTAFGVKVVQDSNAYDYHPPTGLGALGWAIWKPNGHGANDQGKADLIQGIVSDSRKRGREDSRRESPENALDAALLRLGEAVNGSR